MRQRLKYWLLKWDLHPLIFPRIFRLTDNYTTFATLALLVWRSVEAASRTENCFKCPICWPSGPGAHITLTVRLVYPWQVQDASDLKNGCQLEYCLTNLFWTTFNQCNLYSGCDFRGGISLGIILSRDYYWWQGGHILSKRTTVRTLHWVGRNSVTVNDVVHAFWHYLRITDNILKRPSHVFFQASTTLFPILYLGKRRLLWRVSWIPGPGDSESLSSIPDPFVSSLSLAKTATDLLPLKPNCDCVYQYYRDVASLREILILSHW